MLAVERKGDSKLRTPGRFAPHELDPRFVNVEQSAELGDLKKYAEDSEMYHPEMYDEGEDPMKAPSANILGDDVQGKGVFERGENPRGNRRDNQFVPPEQVDDRAANQSAVVPVNRDQDEIEAMQLNNNKMSQIILRQIGKNK